MMRRYFIPLLIFILLLVVLGIGLQRNPTIIPSPLLGKTAPHFTLPSLYDDSVRLTNADFAGQAWILNVFASWCAACVEEHPLISQLAESLEVPVVGLNYKDSVEDARNWLQQYGNPYREILLDPAGDSGIDWGIYGVPESYVIDAQGIIRYKHIGPLGESDFKRIVALVQQR